MRFTYYDCIGDFSYPTFPFVNSEGQQGPGKDSPHSNSPPSVNRSTKPTTLASDEQSNVNQAPHAHNTSQPILQDPTGPSVQPSGSSPSVQRMQSSNGQPISQPIAQYSNLPMTYQPGVHPANQPMGHPTNQPLGHPTNQPLGYPTNQPLGHPTNQPLGHPTNQPGMHPNSQSNPNLPLAQPPMHPATGQPVVYPPAGQQAPIHAPMNQPMLNPTGQVPMMYSTGQAPNGHPPMANTTNPHIAQQTGYYGQVVPTFTAQPLPPAPSVNLPLDLEGRGVLFSNEIEPVEFLNEWYPPADTYYHDSAYSSSEEEVSQQLQQYANANNPRQAYGPLPVPPNYDEAQLLPSHPPVQPPLPPPVSIPVPQENTEDTSASSSKNNDGPVEAEKNTETKTIDIKEEVRALVEEQLVAERAKMREELKEEREKDKAILAEDRKRQMLEHEQRKKEMDEQISKMKEEYEREKKSMMKHQEEMKHYWQSRQVDNEQQRPVIINQVSGIFTCD